MIPDQPCPVPVVVVDDSAVQRRFLRSAIEAAGEFAVVGEGRNGSEAVALVERLRPAAVVLDLDLPVMGGVEAIERIMCSRATPILVYSAFVAGEDSENALEALSAGAVDVLAKPGPQDTGSLADYADTLRRRLRMVSRIRVITHPRGRLRTNGGAQEAALHRGVVDHDDRDWTGLVRDHAGTQAPSWSASRRTMTSS